MGRFAWLLCAAALPACAGSSPSLQLTGVPDSQALLRYQLPPYSMPLRTMLAKALGETVCLVRTGRADECQEEPRDSWVRCSPGYRSPSRLRVRLRFDPFGDHVQSGPDERTAPWALPRWLRGHPDPGRPTRSALPDWNAAGETLGLTGKEVYDITGIAGGVTPGGRVTVRARDDAGKETVFRAVVRLNSPVEVEYYRHGGILPRVLRKFLDS